jgi:hypothetical protein
MGRAAVIFPLPTGFLGKSVKRETVSSGRLTGV